MHGADVQAKDARLAGRRYTGRRRPKLGGADLPLLTLSLLKQGALLSMPETSMAGHRCTLRRGMMLFRRPRCCLRQKAAVDARDKYGWTPLHVAAKYDASATAEVLLQAGS